MNQNIKNYKCVINKYYTNNYILCYKKLTKRISSVKVCSTRPQTRDLYLYSIYIYIYIHIVYGLGPGVLNSTLTVISRGPETLNYMYTYRMYSI